MKETKICKKCGRELPLSEFYKSKTNKDGHMNVCKECFSQQNKQHYKDNKEVILEQQKQRYQDNKEAKLEYQKQYYQDNRDAIVEQQKQHYQDKIEYFKQYYQDNRETILEQKKQYYQTQMGRASNLANNYKWNDKEANRGECTLTPEWIIDNIFSGQKCIYCGESDWHKLGCDRIDNDKPHTPDNVNPCCEECNKKRGTKTYEEFLLEVDISH